MRRVLRLTGPFITAFVLLSLSACITTPEYSADPLAELASETGSTTYDLDDRGWMAIDPFPGSRVPLGNPTVWPNYRSQPNILPRCFTKIDLAVIALPEGWQVKGSPSWKRVN